jgi:hypothetical protein
MPMTLMAAAERQPASSEASAQALSASDLLALARECGADDCGLVSIDNEALAA